MIDAANAIYMLLKIKYTIQKVKDTLQNNNRIKKDRIRTCALIPSFPYRENRQNFHKKAVAYFLPADRYFPYLRKESKEPGMPATDPTRLRAPDDLERCADRVTAFHQICQVGIKPFLERFPAPVLRLRPRGFRQGQRSRIGHITQPVDVAYGFAPQRTHHADYRRRTGIGTPRPGVEAVSLFQRSNRHSPIAGYPGIHL